MEVLSEGGEQLGKARSVFCVLGRLILKCQGLEVCEEQGGGQGAERV